jgi:hypothetical protein
MIKANPKNTTTPAGIVARRKAKEKAIEARRLFCAAIKTLDLYIRSRADEPNAGVVSGMPSHHPFHLFKIRSTLTAPNPSTDVSTKQIAAIFLRHVQTNKKGHQTASHGEKRQATVPGSRHYGKFIPKPRLSDVHTRRSRSGEIVSD